MEEWKETQETMNTHPSIAATLPEIPPESMARATQLTEVLKRTVELLETIPPAHLAEAITSGNIQVFFDTHVKRRQLWNTLFRKIADEISENFNELDKTRHVAIECLSLTRKTHEAFGNKEFKDAIGNLGTFINLCEHFKELEQEGVFSRILAITRHEIPPT